MTYKQSKFNFIYERSEDEVVIYNTYSKALVVLDSKEYSEFLDLDICPVCGAGMYGNKAIKKRKDGSNYKDFYYYGCKHRI